MKKLWLSAIAAVCLLAGNAANAGDHGRGHHHRDGHRGWDRHDHHRCDDDRRYYSHYHDRGYRDGYYRPAQVYYRPVRYYAEPVYYEGRSHRRYDDDISGSITVRF